MKKDFIINIGRQLGSGGRSIANILAQHYNITVYDRKLIELAAKESGLSQEFFENADEKKSHGFFHSIFSARAAANALGSNDSYLSNDALFKVQSDIIRDLAEQESCIFIGRCADYILREYPCCINLFFTALGWFLSSWLVLVWRLFQCHRKEVPYTSPCYLWISGAVVLTYQVLAMVAILLARSTTFGSLIPVLLILALHYVHKTICRL